MRVGKEIGAVVEVRERMIVHRVVDRDGGDDQQKPNPEWPADVANTRDWLFASGPVSGARTPLAGGSRLHKKRQVLCTRRR